jgi:ABC-type molybdate transport system substrate-binding protein
MHTTMSTRRIQLLLILSTVCVAAGSLFAQRTNYGVTVDVSNAAALTKAERYTFVPGQPAYDKAVDQLIITAIDREMKARGVMNVASGPADIVVTYLSVRRTDVDLKAKPSGKDRLLPEYPVGTLVVSVSDAADRQKKLFNGRIDEPLDLDPATYEATINAAVAAIMAKYPRKTKAR